MSDNKRLPVDSEYGSRGFELEAELSSPETFAGRYASSWHQ